MKKRTIIIGLALAGAALGLACGNPGKAPDDGTAPKHHAPRPDRTTGTVPLPNPHPGMKTAK